MKRHDLFAARSILMLIVLSAVTACGEAGPSSVPIEEARSDIGFPLSRTEPAAILDLDPTLYPEEKVLPSAKGSRPVSADGNRPVWFRADARTETRLPAAPQAPTGKVESELTQSPSRGLMQAVDASAAKGSGAGMATARQPIIFNSDGRYPIPDTTGWPARVFVKLFIRWPNGAGSGCSGTLVGERAVLTAGHCVYQGAKGGWASSIRAVPGLDGVYMPFGDAFMIWARSVTGWTQDENNDYDFALITLSRKIGQTTGYAGLLTPSDGTLDSVGSVRVAGYPGDKDSGLRQWQAGNNVAAYDSTMVYHWVDTAGGQSGASVRPSAGAYQDYAFAVHTGSAYYWGTEYNSSTRITNTRFNLILSWIQADLGAPMYGDIPLLADLDGDKRDDIIIWRPTDGTWHSLNGQTLSPFLAGFQYGMAGDIPLVGDFNGDGLKDLGIWRPSDGTWHATTTWGVPLISGLQYGQWGDVPLVGDFDGDKRDDLCIWRPGDGTWHAVRANGSFLFGGIQYGQQYDVPLVADFNGDGKDDLGIWRPADGTWHARTWTGAGLFGGIQYGQEGDLPFAKDFDGDGKADLGLFRPWDGRWYVRRASGGDIVPGFAWGTAWDIPLVGHFDLDRKADLTVWRPSSGTWHAISTSGYIFFDAVQYGQPR